MLRQWPLSAPFILMAAGLALSARTAETCPPAILVAALVCLLLAAFHRSRLLFAACGALFFFSWGLYALAPWLAVDDSASSISSAVSDSPVTVEGVVAARPVVSPDGSRLVLNTEHLFRQNHVSAVHGLLMLYVSEGDLTLHRGDRIRCRTRISLPRLLGLPGEFDYPRYLALQEISAIGRVNSQGEIVLIRGGAEESIQRSVDLLAAGLGNSIRAAVPDQAVSSVLTALLVGDQKRITQQLADAYTRSGVNHILSISGFHVGIIAAFMVICVIRLLACFEYPCLHWNVRRLAVLLALPAMLAYLLITGSAPATARSVIMLAAGAMALYMERESDPLNMLLLAAFALVAINPPTFFDISFQLSFLSLWGIVILVPPLTERLLLIKQQWLRTLLQFIAASLAATCVTLIPVLHTFKVASLNGVLTNFLIVPMLGYGAVLAGFIVLPLLPLLPSYAHLLIWPAAKLVQLSNFIIEYFATLPVVRFYGINDLDLLFFMLFMCAVTFSGSRSRRLALGVLIPLVAIAVHAGAAYRGDGRLHITMLSVGQAESLLLRLPDGSTALVDGGGYLHDTGRDFGQRLLAPALGALGVNRIDRMISTHEHPDHIGGLAYLVRNFSVGEFWCASSLDSVEAAGIRAALAERNIPIRRLSAGHNLKLSPDVVIQVLSPPGAHAGQELAFSDANEGSLVFRLVYGSFSMLFTADAGFSAEQEIMAAGHDLNSTVLKVGHHGSRYATSEEFLQQVQPRLALISAGAGNRFGLPSARTIDLLLGRGIRLCRTDMNGSIELISDGVGWSVSASSGLD